MQSERLLQILSDLWVICSRLTSNDLKLPCDLLEEHAQRFNAAAGAVIVRLDRHRPAGICLFCANVCTQGSANRLMAAMKAAVLERLLGTVEILEPTPAANSL
jgi:hypothetical protein